MITVIICTKIYLYPAGNNAYDCFGLNCFIFYLGFLFKSPKSIKSLIELVVHLSIFHQTTSMQLSINYIKHLSSKLFCVSSKFSPKSKRVKSPSIKAKMWKIGLKYKSVQKCQRVEEVLKLGLGPAF